MSALFAFIRVPDQANVLSHPCADSASDAAVQYHTAAVTGLAFAADGNMLASCSRDGTIALWRVF